MVWFLLSTLYFRGGKEEASARWCGKSIPPRFGVSSCQCVVVGLLGCWMECRPSDAHCLVPLTSRRDPCASIREEVRCEKGGRHFLPKNHQNFPTLHSLPDLVPPPPPLCAFCFLLCSENYKQVGKRGVLWCENRWKRRNHCSFWLYSTLLCFTLLRLLLFFAFEVYAPLPIPQQIRKAMRISTFSSLSIYSLNLI